MTKERDYIFDNLKALLIILVVFGHVIEYFNIFSKIKGVIYIFHMPFFIFISGYFSKKSDNIENKTIKYILIPFFLFNSIYMLCIENTQMSFLEKLKEINIFKASYLYWYLLSLFFWKVFSRYMEKFKYSIILLFF